MITVIAVAFFTVLLGDAVIEKHKEKYHENKKIVVVEKPTHTVTKNENDYVNEIMKIGDSKGNHCSKYRLLQKLNNAYIIANKHTDFTRSNHNDFNTYFIKLAKEERCQL